MGLFNRSDKEALGTAGASFAFLALVLAVYGLRPSRSDGASLVALTTASCLVLTTTHLFWWLSPVIVALAYYGDWIVQRLGSLFDWQPRTV